jgi:hypothetical protein
MSEPGTMSAQLEELACRGITASLAVMGSTARAVKSGIRMRRVKPAQLGRRMTRLSRCAGALMAAVAYLLVLTPSAGGVPAKPWRSLLGSTEVLAPEVSAAIERVLTAPTLERQVHARSARTPLDVYLAFLDAPELTAAAARFLKLASYDVHVVDDDRYEADDGDGARGFSQVIRRDRQRRVIFSQGEHTGPILGKVRGYALTVVELEPRGEFVDTAITAYVYIDDRIAAGLTRVLIASLGFLADRKLTQGLRITAEVAEWAADPSGGFCEWLAREPLAPGRRNRIVSVLPSCTRAGLPRAALDPGAR